MDLTFNDIIATVSEDDIIKNYVQKKSSPDSPISVDEQRYYLAWFAAVVREHVGYENFSQENRKSFENTIENMYNNASNDTTQKSFLEQLQNTRQFIEDNHFSLEHPFIQKTKQPDYHCGKNLCKEYALVPDGYERKAGIKNEWEIGTIGNDTLIVSIAYMDMPYTHEYKTWKDLIETFDTLYEKYPHIILDARNNGGGEDKPLHHIATRLYGNPVQSIKKASVRDTPCSRYLLQHKFGPCRRVPENERASQEHCSGKIKTLIDETQNFYPFNEQTGYKGKIDVLIDNRTASAGESAYSLFYGLPNVRFVGENTRGMQHYRKAVFSTPWGGYISVGVMALEYLNGKLSEKTGNAPDLKVKEGVDALSVALDLPLMDLYRCDGFRPEVQQMQEKYKDRAAPLYEPNEEKTAHADINGIDSGKATDVRRSQFANSVIAGEKRIQAENLYSAFIDEQQKEIAKLQSAFDAVKEQLTPTQENLNYNAGTQKKQTSDKIVVADAFKFKQAFDEYKKQNPDMPDEQAKAQVVFDFLEQNGSRYTSGRDGKTVLFTAFDEQGNPKDITREVFYSNLFNQALTNTNVWFQNMDVKLITLDLKSFNDMPKNTQGLSLEQSTAFKTIPEQERLEIIYERGLYHELLHAVANTNDERKCDTYALLKTMQQHPKYKKAIFDVYNVSRSAIGHTIKEMSSTKNDSEWQEKIKTGLMTYIMPQTYAALKEYAEGHKQIPTDDAEILKLTWQLTQDSGPNSNQLDAFKTLMRKDHLTPMDLEKDAIVQSCMAQGGFKNITQYIENDEKLKKMTALRSDGAKPNGPPEIPSEKSQLENLALKKKKLGERQH